MNAAKARTAALRSAGKVKAMISPGRNAARATGGLTESEEITPDKDHTATNRAVEFARAGNS